MTIPFHHTKSKSTDNFHYESFLWSWYYNFLCQGWTWWCHPSALFSKFMADPILDSTPLSTRHLYPLTSLLIKCLLISILGTFNGSVPLILWVEISKDFWAFERRNATYFHWNSKLLVLIEMRSNLQICSFLLMPSLLNEMGLSPLLYA